MERIIKKLSSVVSEKAVANILYWSSPIWLIWFQTAFLVIVAIILTLAEKSSILSGVINDGDGFALGMVSVIGRVFLAYIMRTISYLYLVVIYLVRSKIWRRVFLAIYITSWIGLLLAFSLQTESKCETMIMVVIIMAIYHLPFLIVTHRTIKYIDKIRDAECGAYC